MSAAYSESSDWSVEAENGQQQQQGMKTSTSKPRQSSAGLVHPHRARSPRDILLFLIGFRILNALCVRTFFQPDEFFQSLEPAWQIAFGKESGAWITWEWKHHLRASIHPYIFAAVYWISDLVARYLELSPLNRADLLIAAPKIVQGILASLQDYYTWKLARKIFGSEGREATWALGLTVLSPWQWFCSTRTLSNCLETTLTIVALYSWPWIWSYSGNFQTKAAGDTYDVKIPSLRKCFLLAAFASMLRPTNLIVWLCLAAYGVVNIVIRNGLSRLESEALKRHVTVVREALYCGLAVLCVCLLADFAYYGTWTLPPFKFLYFNIAQSLAVFYGRNDWHYYLSQGYPLLLTTALPFALIGLARALFPKSNSTSGFQSSIKRQLGIVCVAMPAILSLISHKELRFIYPLLPALHILTAPVLANFFEPAISSPSNNHLPRRLVLIFLVLVNVTVALYTSLSHASGPVKVFDFLRQQHDRFSDSPLSQQLFTSQPAPTIKPSRGITVGFFMPCHSTPWRSHLVFSSIHAWALSCDPPVNFNTSQRASYVDEADQFYDDPVAFLRNNMVGGLRRFPRTPSYQNRYYTHPNDVSSPNQEYTHSWPDYLIFFAQLEPTLQTHLRSSSYAECYRTWNTAWHDDWRRKGDIIVWCMDPIVQRDWRDRNQRVRDARGKKAQKKKEKHFDRIVNQLTKDLSPDANTWTFRRKFGTALFSRFSLPWKSKPKGVFTPWGWDLNFRGEPARWYSRLSPPTSWSWPWGRRKKGLWPEVVSDWWKKIANGRDKSSGTIRDLWS